MENHTEDQSFTNDFLSQSYTTGIEKIVGAKKDFVCDFQVPKEIQQEREKAWDKLFGKYSKEESDDIELNMETLEPAEEGEDKEDGEEIEDREDYYPGARVPMRKSPTRIQYWINTGNPPYKAHTENKEDSEYGSSLSEKELSNSPCTIRRIPLNGCGGKQNQDNNSSCSSVDTAIYILSNANVTKKAETIAIVEGARSDGNSPDTLISKDLKSITLKKGRSLDSCKKGILHDSNNYCKFNTNASFPDETKNKNILGRDDGVGINEIGKTSKKSTKNSCGNNNSVFNERTLSNRCSGSDSGLSFLEKIERTLNTTEKPSSRKKLYSGRDSPIDLMPIRRSSGFKIDQSKKNLHPALYPATVVGHVRRSKPHARNKRKRFSVQSKSSVEITDNAENNNNINCAENNDGDNNAGDSQICFTPVDLNRTRSEPNILISPKALKEHDNVTLSIECNPVNHSVGDEMNEHLSPQFESVQNKDSLDGHIVEEVDTGNKVIMIDTTKSAKSSDLNPIVNIARLPVELSKNQKNENVATNVDEPFSQPAKSQSKRDISSPRVSDKHFQTYCNPNESENLIYVFETQDLDTMESDQSTILICECKSGESEECSSISNYSSLTDDIFEELLDSSLQGKKLSVNSFPSVKNTVDDLKIKLNAVVVLERLETSKAKRFKICHSSCPISAEKTDTGKLKHRDSTGLIENCTPDKENEKTNKKEKMSSQREIDVRVIRGNSNTESVKRNKFRIERRRTRSTTACEGNLFEPSIKRNSEINKKKRGDRFTLLSQLTDEANQFLKLIQPQNGETPRRTRLSNLIKKNYNEDLYKVEEDIHEPVKHRPKINNRKKSIKENSISKPLVHSLRRKSSPLKQNVRKRSKPRRSTNKTVSNPASAETKLSNKQETKHETHTESNVNIRSDEVVVTPSSERTRRRYRLLKELASLMATNGKFFTDLDKNGKRLRSGKKDLCLQTKFPDSNPATLPSFPDFPNKLDEVHVEKFSIDPVIKEKRPQSTKKDLFFQTNFSDSDCTTSPSSPGIPNKLLEVRLEKLQVTSPDNDKKSSNKQATPKLRNSKRISSASHQKSPNDHRHIDEFSSSNKTVSKKTRTSLRPLCRRLNFSDTSDDEQILPLRVGERKAISNNSSTSDTIQTMKLPEEKVIRTVTNSKSSLHKNDSETSNKRKLRTRTAKSERSQRFSVYTRNIITRVTTLKSPDKTKLLMNNSILPRKRKKSSVAEGTSSTRKVNISSEIKDVKKKVKTPDVMNFKKSMIDKYNDTKETTTKRGTKSTAAKPLIFQTKFSLDSDSESDSI